LRRSNANVFRTGNAGDVFNRNLIETTYGVEARNVADCGRRLLLVGSTAHRIQNGDIVCGVGTKGRTIPSAKDVRCRILAVRGPLTLAAFAQAGHDVTSVRSQLDPGLLIRFAVDDADAVPNRVAILPHYRDRDFYGRRARRGLWMIDIDDEPVEVARNIQSAELVYTSSLHGLIFAHALRRPSVLIAPQTSEAEVKYRDYFASVGLPWRSLPTLDEALRMPSPESPLDLDYATADFALPTLRALQDAGIAS
jgi:hypothetical protein